MSDNHPKIYIVIPVYNRLEATRECLESLSCQTYTHFKVVLVDDGSNDGTSDYVKTTHPEVVVLKGDGQLWWTGATNLGVRYALQFARDDDYILTLNNDTVFPPSYLITLMFLSNQMPNALIGSIAFDCDQENAVIDGGVRIHWFSAKHIKLKIPHGRVSKSFYEVSVLSGRGTLIPAHAFHRIGLYDARSFPHYGADYDFSLRARKAGYVLTLHPACYLYSKKHLTGISNMHNRISFGTCLRSFSSIKSPNNLRIRLRFGLRHPPLHCRPTFIFCDVFRVIFGTFRNQIMNMKR